MTPLCWSGSCAGQSTAQTSTRPRTRNCCSEIGKVSLDSFFTREGHEVRDGCPTLGGEVSSCQRSHQRGGPSRRQAGAGGSPRFARLSMTDGYWLFRSWFP